jgi:hypothetical protein
MGHRISRPATIATMKQESAASSTILRCTKSFYVAALLTVLATTVASSSSSRVLSTWSTRNYNLDSDDSDLFNHVKLNYKTRQHSQRQTRHHGASVLSSSASCCFVGAASIPSSSTYGQFISRRLQQDGIRLSASLSTALPAMTSTSTGVFLSPRQHHLRQHQPTAFQEPPSSPARNSTRRKKESSVRRTKLSGSHLSLDYGSSSLWEPLRVRQYNEAARKKKRQKHLLKVVRGHRHYKGIFKLQFKDEGVMQNEVSSVFASEPTNEPLEVSVDFSKAHEHEKLHRNKKCLVLRKDRHGKIRTFWTKVPHDDCRSDDILSTADSEDSLDEATLSVCSPKDHQCAVSCGAEVEEAKIPKPLMRSSEAEGYAATDVTTLRKIFGRNKNKLWGDLDPETTRILYHTLLPRALLRLHTQGLTPDELAPLAYEARCAAKQYARERCNVPGRVASVMFDGVRHVKIYGKWSSKGLTWDQIWEKYEQQVLEDLMASLKDGSEDGTHMVSSANVKDLTTQVCKRILERSCSTNGLVDRVVMSNGKEGSDNKRRSSTAQEVLAIANKFDQEIHELINHKEGENELSVKAKEFMLKRTAAKIRRKLSGLPFYFPHSD